MIKIKEYIYKTKPYQHQKEALEYAISHDRFLLADSMGLGKALALDTKIYTYPNGYKYMRDIDVGDYVFGQNGKPTKVTAIYNHKNVDMYKITFSDGVSIKCCKDHLWKIHTPTGYKIVDTNWFLQKDHLGNVRKDKLYDGNVYKYYIDKCDPVEFKATQVPIHPYVLGALLGDGCFCAKSISFTSKDEEIINKINGLLPQGYKLNSSKSMSDITFNIINLNRHIQGNEIFRTIKRLGLYMKNSHNKFIPDIYKYNSKEVRLSVLQGLLDTDGYANNSNLVQYTTVSKQLAEDVRFIVESLGGLVHWSSKKCGYNGKITGIAYTLTLRFDDPTNLFTLCRKSKLLSVRKFKPRRQISSIEYIGKADAKCITVDSLDHLYLAEHFVVTHNTKTVIDIACMLKQNLNYEHCLIICGVNGLKWNWSAEVAIHSNESSHILGRRTNKKSISNSDKLEDLKNIDSLPYFIITNIESLRYKVKTGNKVKKRVGNKKKMADEYVYPITDLLVELCNSGKIKMISADECHKFSNSESEQGKQFLRLEAETEIAMTGTPIMNSPLDLYSVLKWLGYEQHSFWQYKTHYCRLGGYGGYEVIGYKNLDELSEKLSTLMLRRVKEDVLDLPDKIYKTEYVEMSSEQEKVYNEIYSVTVKNIDLIKKSSNPLSQLIRLRQATGYTGLLSSTIQRSAKLDRLEELVSEIVENKEKVIIFSNWTDITSIIAQRLKAYNPLMITGQTKDSDRQSIVEEFQNGTPQVIIGTTGAMGTGITLTSASNVIFVDEPWNMALREQAEDRAHRIGQNSKVNCIFLITKNTIDERIHSLIEEKGELSDTIVDRSTTVDYLLS